MSLALENFRKVAELEPDNLHTAIEIGWCLYKLKDYRAAIDKYERALQQRPDYASAHACLALAEVQPPQEEVEEVRRGLRINPKIKDRAFWEHNLGTWLIQLDRWEEAVKPLCNAIELKSHEASTHYWLGIAYSQLKRHAEAITEFQKALRTCPNEPDSFFGLGVSLAEMGQFDEAADAYKQVVQLRPENADAYFNLGVANRELGRHDEEIQAYTKAAELNPQDFTIWVNLALAYSSCKKHELAIENLGPSNSAATRQRANINESDVGLRAPRAL